MKKFTSLMLMLLCAVTAWAQNVVTSTEADPVYYVIGSYNRGGFLTNQGIDAGIEHVDLADGSYWYFESAGDDGAVYFVNKLKDGENKIYLGSELKASTTPAKWYVIENGVNTKGLSISKTATVTSYSCIDASNNDSSVGTWAPSASDWNGTTWAFVKCSDCFNATYNPNSLIFRTRSDRYVKTVGLGEETATVDQNYAGVNGRAYFDLTSSVTFEVFVGQEVTPAITRDGSWTNTYVYIDLAGDGFTASIGENGAPAEDLVSYSFYSGDEADDAQGYNSKGDVLEGSSRNTIALPSFIAPAEAGTYRMRFKHDWNSIDPNGGNTNFNSNGGSFIDVTLIVKEMVPTATVNYSYQFNGVEKYTQASIGYVGEEYPALTETAKFPYGITATKPAGTIAESDITDGVINKVIELTCTLPFAWSEDFASVTWQFLKFHTGNGFYLHHTAGQNYISLDAKSVNADDTYYWGFVGNPFDGFKIVNKGAGEGYILSSATEFEDNGGTYPVMTEFASLPEGNNELWVATESTNEENGFYLAQKGFASNRMNNFANNGKLTYWKGGAGAGSTFVVENIEDALLALVDEFKTYALKGLGYIGGYPADKATAIEAIETYNDMVAFQSANNVIALDVNKYYRIQNVQRTTFISVTNGGRVLKAESNADINQLWQVEKQENGKYLVKSPNAGYMQAVGTNALAEEGAEFDINILNNCSGQFELKSGSDNLAGINATTLGKWWNATVDGDMAYRFIEATDIEVSINEFASIYLPFAVSVEGATAYAVEETTETSAIFAEKADIPAYQGAILEGNGTATLTIIDEATADWTNNMLKGSTVDAYLAGPAYVLSKPADSEIGFYKATLNKNEAGEAGETHFKNNANKAYLVVENASPASLSFRFPGTTGIEEVTTENGNVKAIYDLTGRRVEAVTAPGIYIVNGKKVLVK